MKSNSYLSPSLPGWVLLAAGSAFIGQRTPNFILTFASLMALPVFASLLWLKREPPVLFFVVTFQWLEVTTRVFHANFWNSSVSEISTTMFGIGDVEKAIWLGLIGLLVLAIGMRLAMQRAKSLEAFKMSEEVMTFSIPRVFSAYLFVLFLSYPLQYLAKGSAFKEILLAVSHLKWAVFFVLAYTVLRKGGNKTSLYIAILIEMIIGFTGYFSKFTYVFFVLILAVLATGYRATPKNVIRATIVTSIVFFLAVFWSSIKEEHRKFLSGGERQQIIVVPVRARLENLIKSAATMNVEKWKIGIDSLFQRIAYVDMFGYALRYVPAQTPHENGALLKKTIKHLLMPRFLFPDKPVLGSDTAITMKYTGLYMAGEESGTSISIGYMGENYIDFGPLGMFVPIFFLGVFWGLIYRYFIRQSKTKILGYAVALTVLIDTLNFGSSLPKLLGGVITNSIIMAVSLNFFGPRLYRSFSARHV